MLRLTPGLQARLLAQPESGMGYQLVDALQFDGRAVSGIAYNAELLLLEAELRASHLPQLPN